jgi:hypothetical protein
MREYERPKLELADIFNQFSHLLGPLRPEQAKVVSAIKNCRTHVLGGHINECGDCDYRSQSYNSCRNRHCPKCGFTARNQWISARNDELLDCSYFHVVFTVPSELRPLMLRNKEISYRVLFKAAGDTLKAVAKEHLGIDVGAIGVLHTWSQTMIDHPHIHFIVPGGGLNKDRTQWIKARQKFLLPVKKLSAVFRGKLLSMFEEANDKNELKFIGQIEHLSHPGIFKDLLVDCASKRFVVYAKRPFAGPKAVIEYLGQYTHRIAISNYRLLKLEGEEVTFKYRDPNDPKNRKTMTLHVIEFMRRFLTHVLPRGFVRIRHIGLLGSRLKVNNINRIRELQGLESIEKKDCKENFMELLKRITGIDVHRCPKCHSLSLRPSKTFQGLLSSA